MRSRSFVWRANEEPGAGGNCSLPSKTARNATNKGSPVEHLEQALMRAEDRPRIGSFGFGFNRIHDQSEQVFGDLDVGLFACADKDMMGPRTAVLPVPAPRQFH